VILPPDDPIMICGTRSMLWVFFHGIETIDHKVNAAMRSDSGIDTSKVYCQKMEFLAKRALGRFFSEDIPSEAESLVFTHTDSKFSKESGILASNMLAIYRRERA
jgi:hypothetical protein